MDAPKSIYGSDDPPLLARPKTPVASPSPEEPRDPYRHHSHRRRRRRHRDARSRIWVWVIALILTGSYLAYLFYVRVRKAKPAPEVVVEAPVQQPAPALAGVDALAQPTNAPAAGIVRESIRKWIAAREALPSAAELQKSGDLDGAALRLRSALDKNPADLDLRTALAEVLYQARDYTGAEEHLLTVLAADGERASARMMLALSYEAVQRYDDSLAVIEWMLARDPYGVEVHQMAARACLALKRPGDAVTHLRRVTNVQRDNVAAMNMLAQSYTQLGQFHQAVETLEKVIELDAKNSSSYYNLAVCQMYHGGVTQVLETLNRAVTMFGQPFVTAWTASAELAPLRTNESYKVWETRLKTAAKEP